MFFSDDSSGGEFSDAFSWCLVRFQFRFPHLSALFTFTLPLCCHSIYVILEFLLRKFGGFFEEEQDRPSLPKGVDLADPEPLTRFNAYTLELLKETSERSDFSRNPGVGFGLAEAHH